MHSLFGITFIWYVNGQRFESQIILKVLGASYLRIDRNFCSVHVHTGLRKGVYNMIGVISNEPNKKFRSILIN